MGVGLGAFVQGLGQGINQGQQLAMQRKQQDMQKQEQTMQKAQMTMTYGMKMLDPDMPDSLRKEGLKAIGVSWKMLHPESDVSFLKDIDLNDPDAKTSFKILQKNFEKLQKGEMKLPEFEMVIRATAQDLTAKQKTSFLEDANALKGAYEADEKQPNELKIYEAKKKIDQQNQNPATTAIGAYLQKNPNASPDDIIAFSQQLKGKGITMTMPDGTIVEVGGGKSDLTPVTTTALQKDTVGLIEQINEMDNLGKSIFTDALSLQGKVKRGALRLADYAKIDIGEENKEYIGRSRQFIEGIEQVFNKYRKEITGAQAAMKEISMLRDSIINKKLTPSEFKYSYDRYVGQIKRTLRLKQMLLNQGLSGKELNSKLDSMFEAGEDISETEIDRRGDELKNSGMNDIQVVNQLKKEGYL